MLGVAYLKKVFLAFVVAGIFSSSSFATESKLINGSTLSYPGGSMEVYLGFAQAALLGRAQLVCAGSNEKVKEISDVAINLVASFGHFQPLPNDSLISLTYPQVQFSARVTCE